MSKICASSPAMNIFNSCDKKSTVRELDKHLRKNPSDAMAWLYRGISNCILKDSGAAVNDFSKALSHAGSSSETNYIKAYVSYIGGQTGEAEVRANEVIKAADQYFAEAWTLIGDIRFKAGKHQEGIDAYKKAIEYGAIDSNWNCVKIGEYYEDTKNDYKQAMEWYDKAIQTCPYFTKAYLFKAFLARQTNDDETFWACIGKAKRLNNTLTEQYLDNASFGSEVKRDWRYTSVVADSEKPGETSWTTSGSRSGRAAYQNPDDYEGEAREYIKTFNRLSLDEGFSLHEQIKKDTTAVRELTNSGNLRIGVNTKFYNVKTFREAGRDDDGKREKAWWFMKDTARHAGVEFKVFVETTSGGLRFVGATDAQGRLAATKHESLDGTVIDKNQLKLVQTARK